MLLTRGGNREEATKDSSGGRQIVPTSNPTSTLNMALVSITLAVAHVALARTLTTNGGLAILLTQKLLDAIATLRAVHLQLSASSLLQGLLDLGGDASGFSG